jgi:hypothetical protein
MVLNTCQPACLDKHTFLFPLSCGSLGSNERIHLTNAFLKVTPEQRVAIVLKLLVDIKLRLQGLIVIGQICLYRSIGELKIL